MSGSEKVEEIFSGVYRLEDPKNPRKKLIATLNLTPSRNYYGERLVKLNFNGKVEEFRLWDPFRSKLSAAILNGLEVMSIREGTTCLYLGASTGTTVSHISDIVGHRGRVFAVEVAARVARELLENIVRHRPNIIPVIADAKQPDRYPSIYGEISTVYCDIAQPDQTEIAMANCRRFFDPNKGGVLLLVVKASSIDALKHKKQVFEEQAELLKKSNYDILQKIDLEPYDRQHAVMISKMRV